MMKQCNKCQSKLGDNWEVCAYCGAPVQTVSQCESCKEILESSWNYCPFCKEPTNKIPTKVDSTITTETQNETNEIEQTTVSVDDPEYLVKMGIDEINSGQYPQAFSDLQNAANKSPNYYLPHYYLSTVNLKLKSYNNVIKNTDACITIDPDGLQTLTYSMYNNRGLAFERLHKFELAKECFEKGIALNPVDNIGYVYITRLILEQQPEIAYDLITKGLSSQSDSNTSAPIHFTRSSLNCRFEKFKEALDDIDIAIQKKTKNTGDTYELITLGDCYLLKGMILLKQHLYANNIDFLSENDLNQYTVPRNVSFEFKSARRYSYTVNNQEELIKTIKLNVANFNLKNFLN